MSSDMRVRAFAKINRSLRVLGTRADGYHELRTMFQSIGLHDTLTIRAVRGPFRLTCDDPACPTDGTNLTIYFDLQAATNSDQAVAVLLGITTLTGADFIL